MKKIKELTVDEQFEMYVLIKNADVRLAKNGKKFIAFTFQDTSGTSCFSKRQARNVSRQSAGQNHAPAHNKTGRA